MTTVLVGYPTPCGPRDGLGIGSAQAVPETLYGSGRRMSDCPDLEMRPRRSLPPEQILKQRDEIKRMTMIKRRLRHETETA